MMNYKIREWWNESTGYTRSLDVSSEDRLEHPRLTQTQTLLHTENEKFIQLSYIKEIQGGSCKSGTMSASKWVEMNSASLAESISLCSPWNPECKQTRIWPGQTLQNCMTSLYGSLAPRWQTCMDCAPTVLSISFQKHECRYTPCIDRMKRHTHPSLSLSLSRRETFIIFKVYCLDDVIRF